MDVKDILLDKNVEFKSRGRDYIVKCFNPEHEDSHPSMRIDKISGVFHCFSCGYSGDLFKFFRINKDKFIDIKVKQAIETIKSKMRVPALQMPSDYIFFNREYRNIKAETYNRFNAFTSDSTELHMEDRVIFPITNIFDEIVNFHARYIFSDLEPKYVNYPVNSTLPLYPAIVKPINDSIILVEGYLDMLNMHDKGLTNTVCTFGTAFGHTKKQSKIRKNMDRLLPYKMQGVSQLYIMYDGDESGRNAAERLKENAASIFYTETIDLPDRIDPGTFNKQEVKDLRKMLYD